MKQTEKTVKTVSYIAGITAIAGAMLLVVFLVLSLVGLIHPRKERIVVYTPGVSRIYDGTPLQGSHPLLKGGSLHPGHTLKVTALPEYTWVGEYPDEPVFVILDETGADVTGQYDITREFGVISVTPRKIVLTSQDRSKEYDGTPLTAMPAELLTGTLAPGDTLQSGAGNSVSMPGTVQADPPYSIVSANGGDVTDQYAVTKHFGMLEIRPIPLHVITESAEKEYDGTPLSASGWKLGSGVLREGDQLEVEVTASLKEVGVVENTAVARITDAQGKDVTSIYRVMFTPGTLQIQAIPLYISTGSARKTYDGAPLSQSDWKLTEGALRTGDTLHCSYQTEHTEVNSVANVMKFTVRGTGGTDVTSRYHIICSYGTLTVDPRAITIQTGSAQKVYDGLPLSCQTFTVVGGSLCDGDKIRITCTSITDVGYSENYAISCVIHRETENGTEEVTDRYRISYDFGTLKVTAN